MTASPATFKISGSDVWAAEDVRGHESSWSRALNATQQAAIATFARGGEVSDAATSELDSALQGIEDSLEGGLGFCLLRGFPLSELTVGEIRRAFLWLGRRMGAPVSQNGAGDTVTDVRNVGERFGSPHVRGYKTPDLLPFHTDGSDVAALLCLFPGEAGGETRVASSPYIHNRLYDEARELLELLYEPWHFDRQGEEPPGQPPTLVSPIFCHYAGRLSCRYVPGLLRSAPTKTLRPLTAMQSRALDMFDAIAADDSTYCPVLLAPGEVLFVNNYSIVHSRTAFIDASDRPRHLMRLWLTLNDGRPLAPEFVPKRGNTGGRGGVPPMRPTQRVQA